MSKNTLDKKIKVNTFWNAIYQFLSISIGFYMYPLLVNYLDDISLGVWFTLMSIASWFLLFDIGISNGLRNKLSELIAEKRFWLSKAYLSSTYFYFALFLIGILFCISILIYFINIYSVFNVDVNEIYKLKISVFLVTISIVINLFFSINFSLSNALQNNSFNKLRNFLYVLITAISLTILTLKGEGELIDLAVLFFISNLIVNTIMTSRLYSLNPEFTPTFKLISFKLFKRNLRLGLNFFVINVSSVVLFSTDTILISHILGADYVVSYAITLKIFMLFLTILWFYTAPLWSAYAEKFHQDNFKWIRKTLFKSILITLGLFVIMIIVLLNFEKILKLWLGENSYFDSNLVIAIVILIGLRMWSANFSTLLNGLGRTSLQMKLSIITMLLNIPLSIFLSINLNLGLLGIAYGTAISMSLFAVIGPFYTYNILKLVFKNEEDKSTR